MNITMVKVIVVDKGCKLKVTSVKNFQIDTLYKKCNLKKNDNFEMRVSWKMENELYISIFSKDVGRANSENKYELPPPIDKELYYGSLVVVKHSEEKLTNDNAEDLSITEWNGFYEKLFGGFEDLNDESYSEEEDIPEHFKTKDGYSKEDGFIASDGEEEENDYVSEEEEEAHSSTDGTVEDDMGKDSDVEEEKEESEYDSDELGSELSEESYIDSD